MKVRILIYGILVISLVGLYLLWRGPRRITHEDRVREVMESVTTNVIPPEVLTNSAAKPWVRPLGASDADWKEATLVRHMMLTTNKRIDFHARAIDQNGEGVPGVILELMLSGVDETKVLREFPNMKMGDEILVEKIQLISDSAGWFHLTGRRGTMVVVEALKPSSDYLWQQNGYPSFDFDGKSLLKDYQNPAKGYIFHLWKKGVTEPLIAVNCSVPVQPFETNWYAANLVTGEANNFQNADFFFWFETITDSSGNPARRFKFKVLNGGMMIDAKPYPYRAPKSGYQSEWDWDYEPYGRNSRDDLPSLLLKKLYVKIRGGKVYGSINWHWASENSVVINGYLNANGSLNLEPDAEKLITDGEEIHRIDQETRAQ